MPEIDVAAGQVVIDYDFDAAKSWSPLDVGATVPDLFPDLFQVRCASLPARRWLPGCGRWSRSTIRASATDRHRTVDDTRRPAAVPAWS